MVDLSPDEGCVEMNSLVPLRGRGLSSDPTVTRGIGRARLAVHSALLLALFVTSLSVPSAKAAIQAPGDQLWVKRYKGLTDSEDEARSVATDGQRVFVTGTSDESWTAEAGYAGDYATTAYDAATGARLWVRRYVGPGNGYDAASSVATHGGRVFVTGRSDGSGSGADYATVAYDAATGARLWVSRYNGPGNGYDAASSVAADGQKVFVTGRTYGYGKNTDAIVDFGTVAYDAATGARLWVNTYNGPENDVDEAYSVSTDGVGVYVTGYTHGHGPDSRYEQDYATVAYDSETGAELWVGLYDGPRHHRDIARSVTTDGGEVYVTGYSGGSGTY